MAGFGFVKLGKCFLGNIANKTIATGVVDDLVLNTKHIKFIEPRVSDPKFGAKITTIFDDVIDVPAPGVQVDDDYLFSNIVRAIANAGNEGLSTLF